MFEGVPECSNRFNVVFQKLSKVFRGSQRSAAALRGSERFSKVLKSKVLKSFQRF